MTTKQGFFEYCFNDENGYMYEFDTLTEAIKKAKKLSKLQPNHEFNIYGMSNIYITNGKTR